MTTRIAVAGPNTESADAAVATAASGGNAVDAAVAAMLTAMVNEPGIVSLTGGAFLTIWPAGSEDAVTVDGCVAMPGLGRDADAPAPDVREVTTAYGGGVTMSVGHGSVATPGALAALATAHERFGLAPWRDVVAPAQAVATGGFAIGAAAAYYLPFTRETVFAWDPETATVLRARDGRWLEGGDRMVIPGLGGTLDLIASEGARTMYDGALATRIAADMADRGGLVTAADLSSYEAIVRPALPFRSGDWQLRTNPPPAVGGAVLAAMTTLLGERPTGEWTTDDVAHLIDVQQHVLTQRRDRLDRAGDREQAAAELLAEVGAPAAGSSSTVQVSVVDDAGTACAITASSGYGSGATVPGTGLWLNNCLGEHELNTGPPLRPGERLRSNMAPTVGRSPSGAVLAIGTPGADRITTALTQVLASFTTGRAALQTAVDRPRLHVRVGEQVPLVEAEEDMPLPDTELPVRRHQRQSMYFGGVAAALRRPDGSLAAAADPRRAGVVATGPA